MPIEPFYRLAMPEQYEAFLKGKLAMFPPTADFSPFLGIKPTKGPVLTYKDLKSSKRRHPALMQHAVFRETYLRLRRSYLMDKKAGRPVEIMYVCHGPLLLCIAYLLDLNCWFFFFQTVRDF